MKTRMQKSCTLFHSFEPFGHGGGSARRRGGKAYSHGQGKSGANRKAGVRMPDHTAAEVGFAVIGSYPKILDN